MSNKAPYGSLFPSRAFSPDCEIQSSTRKSMFLSCLSASLTRSKKACGGVCIYLSGNNDGALSNRDFWQEVWYDINQPIAAGVSALSLIFVVHT